MKCPNCDRDVEPIWEHCAHCGAALPKVRFCPACGQKVQPGWKFCPQCNTELPAMPDSDARKPASDQPDEAKAHAAAQIEVEDAVVKKLHQEVSGGGGASLKVRDAVVGEVDQSVGGAAAGPESAGGAGRLGQVASLQIGEGNVIKEVHQNVVINVGGGYSLDSLYGLRAANELKARRVYAACGREIRAYKPTAGGRKVTPAGTHRLPESMSGVRSVRLVQQGRDLLILAGARCGVVIFNEGTGESRVYPFPNPTRYGANAATIHGDHLYATHSNHGLLRWPLDGNTPVSLFPDVFQAADTCRAVQVDHQGHLVLVANTNVYRFHADETGHPPQRYRAQDARPLVGVVECGPFLFAASTDGQVFQWRIDDPGLPDHQLARKWPAPPGHVSDAERRRRRLSTYSLALAQLPGGPHLVLGSKHDFLRMIKLDQPRANIDFCTRGGTLVRWARAAADLAVASSHDNRRLLFWHTHNVDEPACDVPVARKEREQIMDICLLLGR